VGGARGYGLGAESCSATAGKEALTGGPRTSARERGEGATDWAKKKERAGEENWAGGEKVSGRKKKRRREFGPRERKRMREKGFGLG